MVPFAERYEAPGQDLGMDIDRIRAMPSRGFIGQ